MKFAKLALIFFAIWIFNVPIVNAQEEVRKVDPKWCKPQSAKFYPQISNYGWGGAPFESGYVEGQRIINPPTNQSSTCLSPHFFRSSGGEILFAARACPESKPECEEIETAKYVCSKYAPKGQTEVQYYTLSQYQETNNSGGPANSYSQMVHYISSPDPDGTRSSWTFRKVPNKFGGFDYYNSVDVIEHVICQTPNRAPTTVPDSATIPADTEIILDPLGNDTDPDNNPLTVEILSQPTNGVATVTADQKQISFVPASNFTGNNTITYEASDGVLKTSGTISLTVTSANVTPSTPPTIEFLTPPDIRAHPDSNNPLPIYSGGCSGAFYIRSYVRAPKPSVKGDWVVVDAVGNLISPVKQSAFPIYWGHLHYSIDFDAPNTAKRPFFLQIYETADGGYPNGTKALNQKFDPTKLTNWNPGKNGYHFKACNTLDQINKNDEVLFLGSGFPNEVLLNEGDSYNFVIDPKIFFDADGDKLSYSITGPLPAGINFDPTTRTFSGVVAQGAKKPSVIEKENYDPTIYPVTVEISDGNGSTNKQKISFKVEEGMPYLTSKLITDKVFQVGDYVNINLWPYFNDPDFNQNFSFSSSNLPSGLSIVHNVNRICPETINHAAAAPYCSPAAAIRGTIAAGAESPNPYEVEITLSDNVTGSVTTGFEIVVKTKPSANDDAATTDEDQVVSIDVLSNDRDPDGDALKVTVDLPKNGAALVGSGGVVEYTPDQDFHGSDSFSYSIKDPQDNKASATVNVTVKPVNDSPLVLGGDIPDISMSGGQVLNMDLEDFFADVDGDNLTYNLNTSESFISLNGSKIAGTLPSDAIKNSPYILNVTAIDPIGATASDSFQININNREPSIVSPMPDISESSEGDVSMDVSGHFKDADLDELQYSADNLPKGLSLDSQTGIISGKISPVFQKTTKTVSIKAEDNRGGHITGVFKFVVTPRDIRDLNPEITGSVSEKIKTILGTDEDKENLSSDPSLTWTEWLNRDGPGGRGDYESISAFIDAGSINGTPSSIECRTRDGVDWEEAGQVYICNLERGGICVNADQREGRCLDYEVRFSYPAKD